MNRRNIFILFGVCCLGLLSMIGILGFAGCYNNTPPLAVTVTHSLSTIDYTPEEVTITVTLAKDANDTKNYTIKLPDGTEVQGLAADYPVARNGEYNFIITDDCGGSEIDYEVEIINIGRTASSLGLSPGEGADAWVSWLNKDKIVKAVKEGKTVFIDDYYRLDNAIIDVGFDVDIFEMRGITENATLEVHGNVFRMRDTSLIVDGVKFVNHTSTTPIVFWYGPVSADTAYKTATFDVMKFANCEIEGQLQVVNASPMHLANVQETTVDSGIGELILENNKVTDGYMPSSFFYLLDYPIKRVLVRGNELYNSAFTFLTINFTEGLDADLSRQISHNRTMLIENNVWINDVDYDLTKKREEVNLSGTKSYLYHCFVVMKGAREIIYRNNHIEGLHHSWRADFFEAGVSTVVYDAYLTCGRLVYTNNVSKNNLALHPGKSSTALFKSKGTLGSGGFDNTARIIQNNQFIVEKDFPARCFGFNTAEELIENMESVKFISFPRNDPDLSTLEKRQVAYINMTAVAFSEYLSSVKEERIENNLFDLITFDGATSASYNNARRHNLYFSHNTLTADYLKSTRGFLGITTEDANPDTGAYDRRTYQINDNTITIAKETPYFNPNGGTHIGFALFDGYTTNPNVYVNIYNNTLDTYHFKTFYTDGDSGAQVQNKINLSIYDNTIRARGRSMRAFHNVYSVEKFVKFENNSIEIFPEGKSSALFSFMHFEVLTKTIPLGTYSYDIKYSPDAPADPNQIYMHLLYMNNWSEAAGREYLDAPVDIEFNIRSDTDDDVLSYSFGLETKIINGHERHVAILQDGTEHNFEITSARTVPPSTAATGSLSSFSLLMSNTMIRLQSKEAVTDTSQNLHIEIKVSPR